MRVRDSSDATVIIGAGIVGLQTAFQLSQMGKKVLVVDTAERAADDCSRANAGIIALGHAEAIGSPAAIKKLATAALGRNPALRITRFMDPALWRWGLHFLKHCSSSAYRRNSDSLLRAAHYSARLMNQIETVLPLHYDRSDRGTLYFYQNMAEFERRKRAVYEDQKSSEMFETLSARELIEHEPAFGELGTQLAGGLLSPSDISGDCHTYATTMAKHLQESGKVEIAYGSDVKSLKVQDGRVAALQLTDHALQLKNLVIAAGSRTPELLQPLGVKPMIYPVKGYSATYPVLDDKGVPHFSAIDETELVSFARYGNRFRITAMAEFAGHNKDLAPDMIEKLNSYVQRLCGSSVDIANASYWCGLRPSTPSSRPYLGKIRSVENLWINAGHGQLGWTLSAGSGKVIADLVCGKSPDLSAISEIAAWLEPF